MKKHISSKLKILLEEWTKEFSEFYNKTLTPKGTCLFKTIEEIQNERIIQKN